MQSTISPLHETLRSAFAFSDERSRRRTSDDREANATPDPDSYAEQLAGLPSTHQALWYRATDFWHIVGWAFNCSVAHKKRWERWKLWLELMLDFLEAEWAARLRLSKSENDDKNRLTESLLWHYVSREDPTNRANRRRMVKAIFAMATLESETHYPEVWKGETTELKRTKPNEALPNALDFENGGAETILRNDEDEVMEDAPRTPTDPLTTRKVRAGYAEAQTLQDRDAVIVRSSEEAVSQLGGINSVHLRQRLIALLVQVAEALPGKFAKLADLFDPLEDELTPLPTMTYNLLLSSSKLVGATRIAMLAKLLLPFVKEGLHDYTTIEPTQSDLEEDFLPRRARTQSYAMNAKFSLVVEHMFMHMMSTNSLQATDDLRSAVERGIKERLSVRGQGKKGSKFEEHQGKVMLEASAERLLGLLEVLEIASNKPPQQPQKESETLSFISSTSELSSEPEGDSEEED